MLTNLKQYNVMAFVKHAQLYEREKKEGREGKRGECQSEENFLGMIWHGPLALLSGRPGLRQGHATGQ